MDIVLVYITTEDRKQAEIIGRSLLEKRLAACVNIVDNLHSMYWWEGHIQSSQEVLLLAKTMKSKFIELCAETRRLHSYQTPCIVALSIVDGHDDFLNWISQEVLSDS